MASFYDVVVQSGQCIFDLATQEYGSPEDALLIWDDNENLGFAGVLTVGQTVKIRRNPNRDEVKSYSALEVWREMQEGVNNDDDEASGFWLTESGEPYELENGGYYELN